MQVTFPSNGRYLMSPAFPSSGLQAGLNSSSSQGLLHLICPLHTSTSCTSTCLVSSPILAHLRTQTTPSTFLTHLIHVLALLRTIPTMAGGYVTINEDQCRHYAGFAAHLDRHHFDIVYWVLFMLVVLMLFTASYKYSRSVPIFPFAPPPYATLRLTPPAQPQLP